MQISSDGLDNMATLGRNSGFGAGLSSDNVLNTAVGAGVALYNAYENKKMNEKILKSNEKANETNLALARDEFDYTKYLNENKFQMQSEDMRKAGINPLASVSSNMQSFSGSAGQSGVSGLTPSDIPSIFNTLMQGRIAKDANATQKAIAKDNNETQKAIADDNNATTVSVAELQAQLTREAHITEKDINAANIASAEKISRLNRESQERIEQSKNKLQKELTHFVEQNKRILQSRQFDFETGDDLQAFQQSFERFKSALAEETEKNRELRNSVVLPGDWFKDGKARNVTLGQAQAYMEREVVFREHNEYQTLLNNIVNVIGAFSGVLGSSR